MARGINKVILVGNVGTDPEIRYLPNGNPVANLSIATSDAWKDKQTGEKQERTEWHRVVFFNRLAEIVSEYVKKGSKLYIEGALRTRKWKDQNDVEKYTTEIIGSEMQMLDSRGASGGQYQQQAPQQTQSNARPQGSGAPQAKKEAVPAMDNFDDDIPF